MSGEPPVVRWAVSPYDGKQHIVGHVIGEITEALCEHSVPTSRLTDPGGEPQCMLCVMMLGFDEDNRKTE